mgnify:CR=1 FL=1
MTKEEIKEVIELKQQEMPFDVRPRSEPLPISGGQIVTLPGVRRCGKTTRMELAINDLLKAGVPKENILWVGGVSFPGKVEGQILDLCFEFRIFCHHFFHFSDGVHNGGVIFDANFGGDFIGA